MELAKLIKVLSSLELPGGIIFLLSVQWFKQQQNKSINLIIKFYAYHICKIITWEKRFFLFKLVSTMVCVLMKENIDSLSKNICQITRIWFDSEEKMSNCLF